MAIPFEVDLLSAEKLEKGWPDLFETARRMFPASSREDIARIVSLVVGTCGYCYSAPDGCCCSRDD